MSIEVQPMTATLGAEVTGMDMADVDAGVIDELRKAWLDHKVLVLRDQHITTEEHIAFGARFGELEVHPFATGVEEHPEIVKIVSNDKVQYAASGWHSDVTWREEPSMGSILRGVVIPPAGGDTCFADSTAAYDRLSDSFKSWIDDLYAIHDFTNVFGQRLSEEDRAAKQAEFPPARHPVVRTHPDTGAKGIYTNRSFVDHIEGVSAEDGEKIITTLEQSIMDPSVQCRVRWAPDTFVMWDNRCVQHFATNDFWPQTRHVERVTIIGDRPH
ncbi:MAG: TauD/TfdA family dioxygenase [Acidobacteria bacterium]|nr:TauD/TfdA family dioxygenase [Acidobacteriota bacterium]